VIGGSLRNGREGKERRRTERRRSNAIGRPARIEIEKLLKTGPVQLKNKLIFHRI
jgi:hypothetical protein